MSEAQKAYLEVTFDTLDKLKGTLHAHDERSAGHAVALQQIHRWVGRSAGRWDDWRTSGVSVVVDCGVSVVVDWWLLGQRSPRALLSVHLVHKVSLVGHAYMAPTKSAGLVIVEIS